VTPTPDRVQTRYRAEPVRIFMDYPSETGWGHVVVTGGIHDSGRANFTNRQGIPDWDGSYFLLKMRKGSILIDAHNQRQHLVVDRTDFSFGGTVPGPFFAVRGTGRYEGIRSNRIRSDQVILACDSHHNRFPKCSRPGKLVYINKIWAHGEVMLPVSTT
jgi:hypothetical protein